METYTITKQDLDKNNNYIGKTDLSNFDGNIRAEPWLDTVHFTGTLRAAGYIDFGAGSGISARGDIISDNSSIEVGTSIRAGFDICVGTNIRAGGDIHAGGNIIVGHSISTSGSICADKDIRAGSDISVGGGISAGLSIDCTTLFTTARILAGVAPWTTPSEEESQILCEKLESGTIGSGTLVLKSQESTPQAEFNDKACLQKILKSLQTLEAVVKKALDTPKM